MIAMLEDTSGGSLNASEISGAARALERGDARASAADGGGDP